jgi:hypothetical protein
MIQDDEEIPSIYETNQAITSSQYLDPLSYVTQPQIMASGYNEVHQTTINS